MTGLLGGVVVAVVILGLGLGVSAAYVLVRDGIRVFWAWHRARQALPEKVYPLPPDLVPAPSPSEEETEVKILPATYEEPLDIWRRTEMPKVTDVPIALMYNGAPVREGDILPLDGPDSGRQIKVLNAIPDEDGGVLVQENYLADPAQLGCTVREERVILDLSKDEARELLDFYHQQHGHGETRETGRFAKATFDDLGEVMSGRTQGPRGTRP